jgi:CRISPR-associated protein (TIGR03986 family)
MSKYLEGVTAPYNFVPFADTVVSPDWHDAVSMDHPFEDGLCGELELTLTAHSPIMVGNEKLDGVTEFFRNHRGLAIPGSSLKGMVRNVMEIAGFGKMPQPNERLATTRKPMSEALVGWLYFDSEKAAYFVRTCRYVSIQYNELSRFFPTFNHEVQQKGDLSQRYGAVGGLGATIPFSLNDKSKYARGDDHTGFVVMTGPGSDKEAEYLFYSDGIETNEPITKTVIQKFLNIYCNPQVDFDPFEYLNKARLESDRELAGIPVFFVRDKSKKISNLAFAKSMKLHPRNTVRELHKIQIGRNRLQHDLAETLLGYSEENNSGSEHQLKGRLSFSDLSLHSGDLVDEPIDIVLMSPSPSFHPAYLKQGNNDEIGRLSSGMKDYQSPDVRLRGFKRYPIQHGAALRPDMSHLSDNAENKAFHSYIRPLKAGATFTGKIRFHNVLPEELGMLLWVLTLGNEGDRFHSLGMGKPYGYGKTKFEITSLQVEHNTTPGSFEKETGNIKCYIEKFVEFMNSQLEAGDGAWESSGVIRELVAISEGISSDAPSIKYMELGKFDKVKEKVRNKTVTPGFALPKFSVLKAKS